MQVKGRPLLLLGQPVEQLVIHAAKALEPGFGRGAHLQMRVKLKGCSLVGRGASYHIHALEALGVGERAQLYCVSIVTGWVEGRGGTPAAGDGGSGSERPASWPERHDKTHLDEAPRKRPGNPKKQACKFIQIDLMALHARPVRTRGPSLNPEKQEEVK